jgi:hypothetical protein
VRVRPRLGEQRAKAVRRNGRSTHSVAGSLRDHGCRPSTRPGGAHIDTSFLRERGAETRPTGVGGCKEGASRQATAPTGGPAAASWARISAAYRSAFRSTLQGSLPRPSSVVVAEAPMGRCHYHVEKELEESGWGGRCCGRSISSKSARAARVRHLRRCDLLGFWRRQGSRCRWPRR